MTKSEKVYKSTVSENSSSLQGDSSELKREPSFANAPTSKKIGFFSAMMIVIGSSVGAGIFFKASSVLENSQNSIIFAVFCWLLAAFAVIAMALALVEIASGRNDNLSMIGWCQTFNKRFTYKACKNFMVYVYLPLTYFFMPLYVVSSIQDGVSSLIDNYNGLGTKADWSIMMLIALGISVYFIVANGLSSKLGNIHNWIITSVKFLPLIFAAILGFVIFGINGKISGENYRVPFHPTVLPENSNKFLSFANLSPGFGMFMAMGAIFFAFDGFYVTAGIQTEMKEPKKTPWAILTGMIVVTVIYLIIAISMSLGSSKGGPSGFKDFLDKHKLIKLYATFQILIGIGVLGVINGFALWSVRFIEDLIKANEVPFSTKFVNKINNQKATVGIVYNLTLSIPVIILFCIIGGLGYVDNTYGPSYGTGVGKLYSFADLMATWTSVIAFTFIMFAIVGGLKNRKINEIKVEKNKFFKPMGIAAVITMILPIFFTFFGPIADLFMVFWIDKNKVIANDPSFSKDFTTVVLIPRIMTVLVLIIFFGLMVVPTFIEDFILAKKYGSVEKGELEKIKLMAIAKNVDFKNELIEVLNNQKRNKLNVEEQKILGVTQLSDLV